MLIQVAVSMTMLLTLAAFSMSASFAYDKRNVLYAAADAADVRVRGVHAAVDDGDTHAFTRVFVQIHEMRDDQRDAVNASTAYAVWWST